MKNKINPNPIESSNFKVVGKMGDVSVLVHVGFSDNGEPIFNVAPTLKDAKPDPAIRLGQLLTFNPEGWDLDEQAIETLQASQPQR